MFGKNKKEIDIETKEYKEMIMNKLLTDLNKLDFSNYSIMFELPESKQTEYNIKTELLNANLDLFNNEEKKYITNFIIHQDTIAHMSEKEVLKSVQRPHTQEQLKRPLVFELAKHADANTLDEIEAVYKNYILNKNREKLFDEDYEEAQKFINGTFKKVGK